MRANTLSMQGLEEIEKQSFDLYKYPEINQFKVNQQQLRHYQIVQIATVNALNSKKIVDFETERMFASEGDKPGIKRPDVLWFTDNGKRIAVEVELSQKWDRAFDEFLLAIIRSLSSKDGVKAKFDRFLIITDSNAIRHNYIEAIQPGSIFYKWEKNHRDHWEVTKKLLVPDWLIQKVDFQLIKNTV
ncbi:MAG TPA: hypothetical protein PL131_14230 [Methylotenera sp.]|nr:hypothetical protein [Methylotenera sp.]HPH07025.1 hypothetical protein [Methylotenera sp.]